MVNKHIFAHHPWFIVSAQKVVKDLRLPHVFALDNDLQTCKPYSVINVANQQIFASGKVFANNICSPLFSFMAWAIGGNKIYVCPETFPLFSFTSIIFMSNEARSHPNIYLGPHCTVCYWGKYLVYLIYIDWYLVYLVYIDLVLISRTWSISGRRWLRGFPPLALIIQGQINI